MSAFTIWEGIARELMHLETGLTDTCRQLRSILSRKPVFCIPCCFTSYDAYKRLLSADLRLRGAFSTAGWDVFSVTRFQVFAKEDPGFLGHVQARDERILFALCVVFAKAWKMSCLKLSIRPTRLSDLAALIALYRNDDIGVTRETTEPDDAHQRALGAIQNDPNHLLVADEQVGKLWRHSCCPLCPACRVTAHGEPRSKRRKSRTPCVDRALGRRFGIGL